MSFMCETTKRTNREKKNNREALIFRCDGMKHVCEIVKDSSTYTGGSEIVDAKKRKKKGRNGVVRMAWLYASAFFRFFFHRLWAERRR